MGRDFGHHGCGPLTYHALCPVCHQEVDETKKKSFRVLPSDILHASRVNEPEVVHKYDQGKGIHTLEVGVKKFKYHRHDETKDAPDGAHARLLHLRCFDLVHSLGHGSKLDSVRLYHAVNAVEPTFAPVDGTAVKSVDGPFVDPEGNWKKRSAKPASAPSPAMLGLAGLIKKLPAQVRCLISDNGCGRMFFVMDVANWMAQGKRGTSRLRDRFAVEKLRLTGDKIQVNLVHLGGRLYVRSFSDVPVQQPKQTKAVKGKLKTRKQRKAAEQAAQSVQSKGDSMEQVVFDLVDKKNSYLAVKSDGVGIVDIAFEEETMGPKWKFGHQTAPFDHQVSQIRNADLNELQVVSDCLKVRAIFPSSRRGIEPYFDSPHRNSHYRDFVQSSICCSVQPKDPRGIKAQKLNINDPFSFFAPAKYMPMHAIKDISIDWCVSRYAGMTGFHVNKTAVDPSTSAKPKSFKIARVGADPEADLQCTPTACRPEDLFHTGTFEIESASVDFTWSGTQVPDASRRVKIVTFEPSVEKPGMLPPALKFIQFEVGKTFFPLLPHYVDYHVASEEIFEDVRGVWWSELPVTYLLRFGLVCGKNSE